MFRYHARLALLSIRKNPIISALTAAAIATGVGACVTVLTIYHMASKNPIPDKSDDLYHVQLDARPLSEDDEPDEEPMDQLTFTDVTALVRADHDKESAAMFKGAFAVRVPDSEVQPYLALARVTGRDFFTMFNLSFIYGSAWSPAVDESGQQVVVLSKETNDKLFGGEDSVGKLVLLDGHQFRVVGVTDTFQPSPKFYDMTNGAFHDSEELFVPFSLTVPLQLDTAGNTQCSGGLVDGFEDFLQSNCNWISYWVHLPDRGQAEAYRDFLRGYSEEQRSLGRYEREPNFRLRNVEEWTFENDVVNDDIRVMVWLSFLFLAVCVLNTVGLILTKFQSRAPQVALRRALGASRWVLLRQNLVEVAALGVVGGVGGIGLGMLGLAGLRQFFSENEAERLMRLDVTMVVIAIGIAITAALIAGLYPAWRAGRVAPASMLKTQ